MAKCPKCGSAQDWWRLFQFDKTQLMVCRICGSKLAMDSERATILIGGGLALMVFPETGLLPFETGILWFLGVFVFYTPFYLSYLKLNLVTDEELNVTLSQEEEFTAYAKGRRRIRTVGNFLFLVGLVLFFGGIIVTPIESKESVSFIGLLSMIIGFGLLAVTRCPFCKKITLRLPFEDGGRCMSCHRDIDIND